MMTMVTVMGAVVVVVEWLKDDPDDDEEEEADDDTVAVALDVVTLTSVLPKLMANPFFALIKS